MKALVVLTDTNRGGTPHRVAAVAQGLSARGWQVVVASVKPSGPVSEELAADGIATFGLELRSPWLAPVALWRLRRLLRRWRPDVVQSVLWHANVVARLAAMGTGIPVVSGYESIDDGKSRPRVFADRATHRLATRHVAVSAAVGERAVARERVRPQDVTVITNGRDVQRWAPNGRRDEVRDSLGIPAGPMVVGWTGRLHPVKDLPTLLQAMVLLPSWRLVVVGDGQEGVSLRGLADEMGLAERVVFTGEVADVPRVLEAFDVFCLPSRWEGLPGSLVEAMAAGLPVVATRVGGIPEIVVDGENGLLVAPGNPQQLADAIAAAAQRPELGDKARLTVQEHFSEEAMVDGYDRLWSELVTRSTSHVPSGGAVPEP